MLKHFSLNSLQTTLSQTLKRFTLPVVISAAATSLMLFLTWNVSSSSSNLFRIVTIAFPCFFLTTTITLLCEKLNCSKKESLLSLFVTTLIVAVSLLLTPGDTTFYTQGALLGLASFFLVFVAPYISKGDENDVWSFGFVVGRRFVLSILFGIVAFLGIALAFGAIDMLLQIRIDSKLYPSIFIFISMFASPLYVLSGLPKLDSDWQKDTQYPAFLRILTQYILLPLVTLYVVILYLYCVSTVSNWYWPSGKMIYYTVAFFIPALLSVIFLTPLKNKPEYTWINKVERIFFIAAVPLLFPYFYAILVRIMGNDIAATNHFSSFARSGFSMTGGNGLTWQRYYVVLFGVWFLGIAIYRLVAKNTNIKYIVISGVALIFITTVGPWSSFSLSNWNQMARLRYVLENNHYLKNGLISIPNKTVNEEAWNEIFSIISYINSNGNPQDIRSMLPAERQKIFDEKNKKGKISSYDVLEIIRPQASSSPQVYTFPNPFVHLTALGQAAFDIPSSQYYMPFSTSFYGTSWTNTVYPLSQSSLGFGYTDNKDSTISMCINSGKDTIVSVDLTAFLQKHVTAQPGKTDITIYNPDNKIVLHGKGYVVTFIIKNLTGKVNNGKVEKLSQVDGVVFVGKE